MRQQGFILVATLWVLAIATVALSIFSAWVYRAAERTADLQSDTRAAVEMVSTRDTLFFLMSSNPMTGRGIGLLDGELEAATRDMFGGRQAADREIIIDGRPYQGISETVFSAQDEAGQLNLNLVEHRRQDLDHLLMALGVEYDRRPRLLYALQDYTDHGSQQSLLGPARGDYRDAGRPEPMNRPLLTVQESWRVFGWDRESAFWEADRLANLTTVLHYGALNLNTAPEEVLHSIPYLDAQQVQHLIDERRRGQFNSPWEAEQRTGVGLSSDAFSMSVVPSNHIRLNFWNPDTRRGYRYYVSLTPTRDGGGPWLIDHVHPITGAELSDGDDPEQVASPIMAP